MKKILSMVLVLTLALSVIGIATASAEYDPSDDIISDEYNYEILEDGTVAINQYLGTADEVTIPPTIDGRQVTVLHRYSFAFNENLRKVIVPEGVTRIGYWAFEDSFNIEELVLPDSLRDMSVSYIVDTKVFRDAENWQDGFLYINNHLVDIKESQVKGKVEVREGTITICDKVFKEKNDITEVILPEGLKSIGETAFEDCKNLEKIYLPDSLEQIGFCAFDGDEKLADFSIPKGIKEIGPYAFRGTAAEEINLPEGLEKIDYDAFSYCKNITNVKIPETVTHIGDGAFFGCENLAEITLPKNLTHLGDSLLHNTAYYNNKENWQDGLLYHGTYLLDSKSDISGNVRVKDGTTMVATRTFCFRNKISSVYLPDSVEYIGAQCFGGSDILREVRLPKNLRTIEPYAFLNCPALEKIYIPEGVTEIPTDAFFCCENLDYISIPASVATIDEYSIGYIDPYYDQGDVMVGPESYIKNENLVIAGYKGTAAEKYATENGFKFKDLDAQKEYKYKDKVLELLGIPEEDPGTGEGYLAYYGEVYEYYSSDSATPDFVLVSVATNMAYDAELTYYFDEYVMYESSGSIPYPYGYAMYFPETNSICDLVTAWNMDEREGFKNIFTEANLGELVGDINYDGKVNIRDATLIQKHLAELEDLYIYSIDAGYRELVPDYNRDGKLNIRDATAIQKHIAKLDTDDPDYKLPEFKLPENPTGEATVIINDIEHKMQVGDIFTVGLMLRSAENISQISIDAKYDADLLKAVRVDDLSQEVFVKNHFPKLQNVELRYPGYGNMYSDGYINVMTKSGDMDFSEESVLCYLSFKVAGTGTINLKINTQWINNTKGEKLLANNIPMENKDIKLTPFIIA